MRRFSLPLTSVLVLLCTATFAPAANAALYGAESTSDFVNSNATPATQAKALDKLKAQGGNVLRVNIGWNEIATSSCADQSVEALKLHTNPCYSWAVLDSLVDLATERRIRVLASVSRAPSWLHGSSDPYYLGRTSGQFARTVQHFAAFMGAIAERYDRGSEHGTIRLWTIWNEPNSDTFFKPMDTAGLRRVAPKRYALLYARAAAAVRAAHPTSSIAVGPTGPRSTLRPVPYIAAVQKALVSFLPGRTIISKRRYIDAWAHNPYTISKSAPSTRNLRSPVIGMSNVRDLFRVLDRSALTRGLRVWATEFGYETNPPDSILGISPSRQARYLAESFDWLESTGRITVLIWYGLTDSGDVRGDWQSGTYYANGRPKPAVLMFRRPISVPTSSTRAGRTVRVWGRSSVNPRGTRIVMSTNGGRTWRRVTPYRRKADGSVVVNVRVYRTTRFAVHDGTRGPARVVFVRR